MRMGGGWMRMGGGWGMRMGDEDGVVGGWRWRSSDGGGGGFFDGTHRRT